MHKLSCTLFRVHFLFNLFCRLLPWHQHLSCNCHFSLSLPHLGCLFSYQTYIKLPCPSPLSSCSLLCVVHSTWTLNGSLSRLIYIHLSVCLFIHPLIYLFHHLFICFSSISSFVSLHVERLTVELHRCFLTQFHYVSSFLEFPQQTVTQCFRPEVWGMRGFNRGPQSAGNKGKLWPSYDLIWPSLTWFSGFSQGEEYL